MDTGEATISEASAGSPTADELAYRLHQMQAVADFGLFALKTHDVATLLQEATHICAQRLRTPFCKVLEYLPAEHQFLVRNGVGWKPGVVGEARIGADLESPAGYAFQTGQLVISNHLQGEQRFRTPTLLVEHGVKRAINVLIQSDSKRYGVLEVDSSTEGRFNAADGAFLQGFANLLGVALERQHKEQALQENEALLRRAAEYQEVLTREISHRVKNSLTIVASLLTMQSRISAHEEVRHALADAETRVRAIALVHDQLWRMHDIQAVNLAELLRDLCEQFQISGKGPALVCNVEPIEVTSEQAVPLGLLANELVTNALKYAYPDGQGEVRLSVTGVGNGLLRLEVRDHGVGLPPDFNSATSNSLGMKLISSLGQQLGGRPEWQDGHPGTRFVLEFSQARPGA